MNCDVNERDVNKCDVNERDVNKKQNPHSLFKVYHHRTILRPKKEMKLKQLKGSRDYLHAVRNTGIKGVVEYRNFDCGCLSCTTHTNECLQNEYADEWEKFSLLLGKKKDLSFNTCDWFKAVEVEDRPNNDAFMQFEEEIDDTVHCDEIENEDYTEPYVTEDNNNVSEEIVEEYDEEIVEEGDRDVTDEERDVTEEESDKETVEEGDRDVTEEERDVTEEGKESDDSLVELYTIPYESSSDNSSDEELPAIYQPEMSPLSTDEDACIHFNWDAVLKDMKTYITFNSLKQYVSRTWCPEVSPDIKYNLDDDDIIDTVAQHFYPRKDGPKGYLPVETCGDGNCGYRALAHVLLSDESWHREVCVRITFKAVLQAESFLSHQLLSRGVTVGSADRAASYALYSGLITPEITRLSEDSIHTVYQCDVMANSKEFNFMGVWQLHHAAKAFKRPVGSVYPWHTNRDLRKDLNRIILPLTSGHDLKRPVYIMWTPLSTDHAHSNVKHFVALLVIIIIIF